jgi:hypothetical protein
MAIPTSVSDLSATPVNNSPIGTDVIGTTLDDYIRSHAAIIRQVSDAKADLTALSASSGSSLVGYLPAGVNAQAQTVQEALRPTIWLDNYKLISESDYTNALQRAVTASGGSGGYGKIYLKQGKIYDHGQIILDGIINLTIIGQGSGDVAHLTYPDFGGASALNYTGTTGVGISFTGVAYAAAKIVFEDVLIFGSTDSHLITFNNCSQIHFNRTTITNNSSALTSNGVRFSKCFYVYADGLVVWKAINQNVGTCHGVDIDMGVESSFLGGDYDFSRSIFVGWQTGMQVGTDVYSVANENYANVNIGNSSEFSTNENGVFFAQGVKNATLEKSYLEGNGGYGALVALGAKNVTISNNFFNNPTAASDISLGISGGGTGYQTFYNARVQDNTIISVHTIGIYAYGDAVSKAIIENNYLKLYTAGALGILSNSLLVRQGDNTFDGFATGNEVVGTYGGSHDINTGTFTATATGMTASVTGTAYYEKTGNRVTVTVPGLSGTSNDTTFTITGLPTELHPTRSQGNIPLPYSMNNGVVISTAVGSLDSSGIFSLYPTNAYGVWSNANGKQVGAFNFTYLLT